MHQCTLQFQDFYFSWQGEAYRLSFNASVVALDHKIEVKDLELLLDQGMREAKARGENEFFFLKADEEKLSHYQAEMTALGHLKRALGLEPRHEEDYNLVLFAQPIVALSQSVLELEVHRLMQRLKNLETQPIDCDVHWWTVTQRWVGTLPEVLQSSINLQVLKGLKMPGQVSEVLVEIEQALQTHLRNHHFEDFQAYEILVRMRDPAGELIPPYQFLPLAENYNLMVDLDIHNLDAYFNFVQAHPEHLKTLSFVNINLGGETLIHPKFKKYILKRLEDAPSFPWHKIVLEVTEQSSVGSMQLAKEFIEVLQEKGMRVALDDFGTGYASFEYLKHMPFDVVKIDGAFIQDILDNEIDHQITKNLATIAKLRHQEVIAEFVDSQAIVDELVALNVDYGQGFYLGKPRPLEDYL